MWRRYAACRRRCTSRARGACVFRGTPRSDASDDALWSGTKAGTGLCPRQLRVLPVSLVSARLPRIRFRIVGFFYCSRIYVYIRCDGVFLSVRPFPFSFRLVCKKGDMPILHVLCALGRFLTWRGHACYRYCYRRTYPTLVASVPRRIDPGPTPTGTHTHPHPHIPPHHTTPGIHTPYSSIRIHHTPHPYTIHVHLYHRPPTPYTYTTHPRTA